MSTGFSEKERAFVEALAGDTGRDLAQWMAVIAAQDCAHRNDIIDWLRQQGFTFSRASWLERIHHNGGKLIYGEPARPAHAGNRRKTAAATTDQPPVPSPPAPRPASDQDIDTLLLAAKAYRPLAQALLRDILAAVPGADAAAVGGVIVFSHARPFAAVAPSSRDVRLYLRFATSDAGVPQGWQKVKLPSGLDSLAALTHMLILTDARQINADLRRLVVASGSETG